MRRVKITWVDVDGNAVCIGLDETIETDWTIEECREAAVYRGQCQEIDLDRYYVEVIEI